MPGSIRNLGRGEARLTARVSTPANPELRSTIVLYLVAFFLPPLALLMAGKPIQAIFSAVIYALAWLGLFLFVVPGVIAWLIAVIHAAIVISSKNADARTQRIVNAVQENSAARE